MATGGPPVDPPVYRPFALLAFASAVLLGSPLGVWLLAGRYLAAPAVPAALIWLHAGAQLFGFFATLIVGVAHHLLPRFTGRPVRPTALTPVLVALLAGALALRAAGALLPALAAAGSALHAAAFAAFAAWVWRALDPPPLSLLRRQLTLSSAWLAAAAALEAVLRVLGGGQPDAGWMAAVYAMTLAGGVLGWVLGVLLRAGPMFVRDWRVPGRLAQATPWLLAAAVVAAVAAAAGMPRGPVLAALSDVLASGTTAAVALTAGALRRARGGLPMLSRSAAEARIFRIAVGSALVATALAVVALVLAAGGDVPRTLADAVRHLLTVGVVGAVVVAMAFRLIPVLEGRALPWPRLRAVAFWALLGAATLRTVQAVGPGGWTLGALVTVSGVLAWTAFACVAVSVAAAVAMGRAHGR